MTPRRYLARVLTWIAGFAVVSIAPGAWGQTVVSSEWRQGTTLSGFAGAEWASSDTQPAAGAALGWEIAPHFTLEGRALWLDAGREQAAFAALLGARVPLLPARPVVPFLSAGLGVYRAVFDSVSGAAIPSFYRRRMVSEATGTAGRTFDDFAVALGGGADLFLARHLAIRPEFTVLLVTADSDTRTVPVFGVHLAYHFESHPITPGRQARHGGR